MSKYQLLFRQKAEFDLEEIQAYYHQFSLTVTRNFFTELFETLTYIEQNPTLFQERYRAIRIAPLYCFPYGIHYRVTDNKIIIYRVLHTRRYFKS
jgi:plasmid stabilization system protein ParE